MTSIPRWLRDIFQDKPLGARPGAPRVQDPSVELLELARTLARDGQLHDAAREYAHIARRYGAPTIWLEHAELLLAIGDHFGAASNATRVLEVEPQNQRALAVRRAVLASDEGDGR